MGKPSEKFELIHEIVQDPENTFTIKQLCELNHVSRSGYYNWLHSLEAKAAKEEQDRADFDLILQAYLKHGRKKGARQIYMVLQHMDPPVTFNLKKIRRLCRKYGLKCPIRKANPYRRMAKALRTDSVSENLIERKFEDAGPRKILLTDITYIPYNDTFAYLSTILDAYTKQILAYEISDSLKVDFVLETVHKLFRDHGNELDTDTIIHSDQGCHYTSIPFRELVKNKKLRQSMSRKGNCWDNAPQESFFGHMKDEIRDRLKECSSYEEVKALIHEQIEYYNTNRYQWKLAKLSPDEYYQYSITKEYPIQKDGKDKTAKDS